MEHTHSSKARARHLAVLQCAGLCIGLAGSALARTRVTGDDWHAVPGGFALARPGPFELQARVDHSGLWLEVLESVTQGEHAPARIEVGLEMVSFGRVQRRFETAPGEPALVGDRIEIVRDGCVEWFERHTLGVEHGWTITTPPHALDAVAPTGSERIRSIASHVWIGLEFRGLGVQLTEDGKAARLVDGLAQEKLRYQYLQAFDADQRLLSARFEVVEGRLGICVDDHAARYPITVDPILGPAVQVIEGECSGCEVDRCMAAGDVNGDGYGDLVVGALGAGSSAGRIRVFHGSPSGIGATPNWISDGPFPTGGNQFGRFATAIGDINGDGFDDLAVGSAQLSHPESREGAVSVFRGSAIGLEASPVWLIEGNAIELGYCRVHYAGDVNADGMDDLLLSSETFGSTDGIVRLYFGSGSGTPPAAVWTLVAADLASSGVTAADFRGSGLRACGAGDINQDGYDDILVGASSPGTTGRAFLFLGGPGGPASAPAWSASGPTVGDGFGVVHGVGDLNGDGRADVAVGAPLYTGTASASGALFVYLNAGGGLPATYDVRIDGPVTANANLVKGPNAWVGAGDINGDGFADLVLGAEGANSATGGAYLCFGSATGPSVAFDYTIANPVTGCTSGCAFGSNVGTAGDIDGDGFADVFVSARGYSNGQVDEGSVWLYFGQRSETPLVQPSAPGHVTSLSGPSTSRFGAAVSASGDVNGDGYSDALIGAPEADPPGAPNGGRVELHLGSASGIQAASAWFREGTVSNGQLGASVAFAGDVNNDGFGDVLVGEPNWGAGQFHEGRFLLFLGNAGGLLGSTPAFSFESNEASAVLGTCVAGAGDVNGDGNADVLACAPGNHLGQVDRGAVYLFYGRHSATPPYFTTGPVLDTGLAGIRYGASASSAGDVNGDGYSDVLVGASDGGTLFEQGVVYLYLGGLGGLATTANWSYSDPNGAASGWHLGACVSGAGDIDADGFADIVIGSPDYQAASAGGAAYFFRGRSGVPPNIVEPPTLVVGGQANASAGRTLAPAGDVNGDGYSDVLVGAPAYDTGLTDAGRVMLLLGSSGGVLMPPVTFDGTAANAAFGSGLGSAGDHDGDGFSDCILGGPGYGGGSGATVLMDGATPYGNISRCQQRRTGDTYLMQLLCLNTDSTSDLRLQTNSRSFLDLAWTLAGRERIRLQWEIKAVGGLLDGAFLVSNGVWFDSGTTSTLNEIVTGVVAENGYLWRARVQNKNPLYPHTRWFQIQGNGKNEKKFGLGSDCNSNNVPDDADIANLTSADCDPIGPAGPNGIPDECELLGNDLDGDGVPDACQAQVSFCTPGSAGVVTCPCNNQPVGADRGCQNSLSTGGASITGSGTASLVLDTLVLSASGVGSAGVSCSGAVTTLTCILLQGPMLSAGGVAFGDGVRCFAGSLKRINVGSSSSGVYSYGPGIAARSALLGDPIGAYSSRFYLVYYRDSCAAYCPSSAFNSTNGRRVIWDA